MPANGVFIGAGAALNKADFGNQDLFGFAVSDVYAVGFWVANGQAAGSTYPDLGNETGASFVLQGGFYRTINDTPWVWGARFSYNSLGLTGSRARATTFSSRRPAAIPAKFPAHSTAITCCRTTRWKSNISSRWCR